MHKADLYNDMIMEFGLTPPNGKKKPDRRSRAAATTFDAFWGVMNDPPKTEQEAVERVSGSVIGGFIFWWLFRTLVEQIIIFLWRKYTAENRS